MHIFLLYIYILLYTIIILYYLTKLQWVATAFVIIINVLHGCCELFRHIALLKWHFSSMTRKINKQFLKALQTFHFIVRRPVVKVRADGGGRSPSSLLDDFRLPSCNYISAGALKSQDKRFIIYYYKALS